MTPTPAPISYLAPAKINLFLHITARRPDGYHDLQTVFQFLTLCDVLHFQLNDTNTIQCHTETDIAQEENLVYKAATLLQQNYAVKQGITIQIDKKIPMGAGLGGGSSNAATTLLALNTLWALNRPTNELMQLGAKLGADVPIFIHGQAAWAEGIGEQLQTISLDEPYYLVVYPNCHVSTQKIFTDPHLTRNTPPITMPVFHSGDVHNDCETVVIKHYPEVKRALNWLSQYGHAKMTGTGACVFAAFATQKQAKHCLEHLPTTWQGFVTQGQNQAPFEM